MATLVVRVRRLDGDPDDASPAYKAFREGLIALIRDYDPVSERVAAERVDDSPDTPLIEREDTSTAEDELLAFEGRLGTLIVDELGVPAFGRVLRGAKSETWS